MGYIKVDYTFDQKKLQNTAFRIKLIAPCNDKQVFKVSCLHLFFSFQIIKLNKQFRQKIIS